jgi:hypothetical protein
MELVAGPPSHWIVTLAGGSRVDVRADAVTGLTVKTAHHEHVVFGVLTDIDVDLQDQFQVTARTPARGRRVEVAVARFPRSCLQTWKLSPDAAARHPRWSALDERQYGATMRKTTVRNDTASALGL